MAENRTRKINKKQSFHIYNRGTRKLKVFLDKQDYSYFFKKMGEYFTKNKLKVSAFSLMPNHYHAEPANVRAKHQMSKSMRILGISYGMYFVKKYKKCGHVFQGTFKRKPLDTILDFVHVAKYIHQNPMGLCFRKDLKSRIKYMQNYEWSSYRYYLNNINLKWLDKSALLRYFASKAEFQKYMEDPLLKWELAVYKIRSI